MKKLVAYITAGFPDKAFTVDLVHALRENGVDILEFGIPFSDPVADGPIIEEANLRALRNGFKMADLFEISSQIAGVIPTFWMGYFNPFYHKGLEYMVQKAKELGIQGFIIPDLPFEESLPYRPIFKNAGLSLIDFVAPTDSAERIETITRESRGFIYLVAYAGITGAMKQEDVSGVVFTIRKFTKTPVFIGFGVNEKTAKEKAKDVDGVIVGSAFVKYLIRDDLTKAEKITKIVSIAKQIKESINE